MSAPKNLDINTKHATSYCIPIELRDAAIRTNVRKVKGRLVPSAETTDEPVAIVGFGPSLADTYEQIRGLRHIITVSGSHKFLLDKGFTPGDFDSWRNCDVDPREHKIELLGTPCVGIEYLPASCCHPKYINHLLKHGCDVKLWHVFAQDGESEQVIPRGEYSFTGGCDVAMRAMTIARCLGFTKLHIFGVDGCFRDGESHAAAHPNSPKSVSETIYEGKTYKTTPALLESGKQVFHELNQMPDVAATFHGEGLVQAMAANYVRKPAITGPLADMRPELISDEMRRLNAQLHEENPHYGVGGGKYAEMVLGILREAPELKSVLDYGAGKCFLAKSLPFPIWSYDPAIPEISEPPRPADLVISTDVLEHIEPEKLPYVLKDLQRVVLSSGFFVIHLGAAKKTYSDGRNAHLIQKDANWWVKKLDKYFKIVKAVQNGPELHVGVGVKVNVEPVEAIVGIRGKDGIKARFYVPNETCRWRAETLTTKEPVTIDWLGKIPAGATLFDIGANVGGYSVWAGVRGVNVIAFEPEAENYALLVRNLILNNLPATAFPIAVTDKQKLDVLHMSGVGVGGSCHSFGQAVGAFGETRNGNHPEQACVGMSIDELVAGGVNAPDYIKIDVDGFETKVISGAHKTLKGVKSLLIEVNPALPAHLQMVDELTKVFGFTFDPAQVEKATRKEGPFKGVGEIVFYRETAAERHLAAAIAAAELKTEPFPYIYVENVLPDEDYKALLASLPPDESYVSLKKARGTRGYPQRFVAPDFARPEWIDAMRSAICAKFGIVGDYADETVLIRDRESYQIGPHTDHKSRVASVILYLAANDDHPELGTSIYEPKKKGFVCEGGPHYKFEQFNNVGLMPYKRNAMVVFVKGLASFHGVEKTTRERDVLLFDVRRVQ